MWNVIERGHRWIKDIVIVCGNNWLVWSEVNLHAIVTQPHMEFGNGVQGGARGSWLAIACLKYFSKTRTSRLPLITATVREGQRSRVPCVRACTYCRRAYEDFHTAQRIIRMPCMPCLVPFH